MKISKSLLQSIAVAVAISTTVTACTKDTTKPADDPHKKKIENADPCPACGMG